MPYSNKQGFPTDNDLGGLNLGRVYQDSSHDKLWGREEVGTPPLPIVGSPPRHGGCNWVKSGFDYSAGGVPTLTLNGGTVIIDGRYYEVSGTADVTVATLSLVWVEVDLDGNNRPIGLSLIATDNVTPPPPRACFLGYIDEANAFIQTVKPNCPVGTVGSYVGDGAATKTIYIGYRPFMLMGASPFDSGTGIYVGGRNFGTGEYGFNNLAFSVGVVQLNNLGVTYEFNAIWGPSV